MHEVSLEARMEFYDTCALLNSYDSLQGKKFVISEISLKELEEIKSNRLKDEETKFKARQVSKVLLENAKNIEIVRFTEGVSKLWKINELAEYLCVTMCVVDLMLLNWELRIEEVVII